MYWSCPKKNTESYVIIFIVYRRIIKKKVITESHNSLLDVRAKWVKVDVIAPIKYIFEQWQIRYRLERKANWDRNCCIGPPDLICGSWLFDSPNWWIKSTNHYEIAHSSSTFSRWRRRISSRLPCGSYAIPIVLKRFSKIDGIMVSV